MVASLRKPDERLRGETIGFPSTVAPHKSDDAAVAFSRQYVIDKLGALRYECDRATATSLAAGVIQRYLRELGENEVADALALARD